MGIQISVGQSPSTPDGSTAPAYATPGAITASIAGTLLTVTGQTGGVLQIGQTLADTTSALLPGTLITGLGTGAGGLGTYEVNQAQTVASEAMTTSMTLRGRSIRRKCRVGMIDACQQRADRRLDI